MMFGMLTASLRQAMRSAGYTQTSKSLSAVIGAIRSDIARSNITYRNLYRIKHVQAGRFRAIQAFKEINNWTSNQYK